MAFPVLRKKQRGYLGIAGRRVLGGAKAIRPSLELAFGVPGTWERYASLLTFTRATTATVTGFEGLIKSCLSGELRVQGARRVRNLLTNSEDLSGWTASGAGSIDGGASDPLGGTSAYTFTAGTTNEEFYQQVTSAISAGDDVLSTTWVRRRTGSGAIALANASGGSFITIPVTTDWQRLSAGVAVAVNTTALSDLRISTSGDAIDVWHPQVENVTGQSIQNPSEYVSVGVESSPFHGYFADGVKYFSYENGNTVSSNVVTEASGAAITGTIGYLAEGARTNLCLQSQTLDNASWVKTGTSISANAYVAPDGTTTMDGVVEDTALSAHGIRQDFTLATTTTYTWSVYLRYVDRRWVFIDFYDSGIGDKYAWVDLQNGVLGTVQAGITASIESTAQAGVYRVKVTKTTTSGTLGIILIRATTADNSVADFTGTSKIFGAWGGQLEAGAFASTYIPTTTAAVARNGDLLTFQTAGILDGTQGNIEIGVAFNTTVTPAVGVQSLVAGTLADWGITTGMRFYDGTNNPQLIAVSRLPTIQKMSVSYSGIVSNGFVSGVQGTPGTFDGDAGFGATAAVGSNLAGSTQIFGVIQYLRIHRTALSIAQNIARTA